VQAEEAAEVVDEETGCAVRSRDQSEPQSPQCQAACRGKDLTMISRKWLYSYRMLTERLHQAEPTPASQTAGFTVGSAAPQSRQISLNDELTENNPAKPAFMLTAGTKR